MIEQVLTPSLVENLGWTILHSLWEMPAVAALLAMTLRRIPAGRAELRYAVCCAGLAVMALAPVATFLLVAQQAAGGPGAGGSLRMELMGAVAAPAGSPGMPWPVMVVNVWALGCMAMAVRLAGGLYAARRLRMRASQSALPEDVRRLAHAIAERLGIGKLRIAASSEIGSPLVAGVLRPMVLLPLAALSQLPPEQWEAILAHELAHIRRYDLLVNFCQSVLETVYFYHPAFWWVSRQVRREREHCCDDLAVRVSGDALVVARALVSLEQLRQRPLLALAANEGPLFQRLQRLLMERTPASAQAGPMALAAVMLMLIAGSVQAWQAPPPPPAPPAPPAPAVDAPAPPKPPRPPRPPRPAGSGSIHIDDSGGVRRLTFHDTDGS